MDPIQAPIPQICSFLSYILEERKLSVDALKGYRSAISSVIKTATAGQRDLSGDASLRAYIRHHVIARPRPFKYRPPWDLGLVLTALTKPPYEPLKDASLKQVTLKAIFLLALATGRRRSFLHALMFGPPHTCFAKDGSGVSLRPCPGFVAKNERPNAMKTVVSIPALQGPSTEDHYLCPVRALHHYTKVTANPEVRQGRSRLFIPHKREPNPTEVSLTTVSRWIKQVVVSALKSAAQDPAALALHQVRAHDLRALAASWAGFNEVSLDEICKACFWKNQGVFQDRYLKDMTSSADGLYTLGGLVVAHTVVNPPAST